METENNQSRPPADEPPGDEPCRPGGESFMELVRRKRRQLVAKAVSRLLGEKHEEKHDALPGEERPVSIKQRIEERGLVHGLADKLRGAADEYIAVKLDEIEQRIDAKLEEIDRRLAEWRDKEITNRLRIIKITLWASIIVALISVAYAWIVKHFFQ